MYSPLFDKLTIENLYSDATDDLIDIWEDYLQNHTNTVAEIKEAFLKGKVDLCNTIHFHSSVFMYVGFPQLTNDCLDFERKCKTVVHLSELTEAFNSLVNCIDATSSIVKYELSVIKERNKISQLC